MKTYGQKNYPIQYSLLGPQCHNEGQVERNRQSCAVLKGGDITKGKAVTSIELLASVKCDRKLSPYFWRGGGRISNWLSLLYLEDLVGRNGLHLCWQSILLIFKTTKSKPVRTGRQFVHDTVLLIKI